MSRDALSHLAGARVLLERSLPQALPPWLASQRWFADKGRPIAQVAIEDLLLAPVAGDALALVIARLAFASGEGARYFVPLAVVAADAAPADAVPLISDLTLGVVVDATAAPWLGGWLLARLGNEDTLEGGNWIFSAAAAAMPRIAAARGEPGRLMGAEQSNSSLRYGDALIVKLFRRLQPGPNPDAETLRALAGSNFPHVPRYAGAAAWRPDAEGEFPLALAQAFVPNEGDGWDWMLARLAAVATGEVDLEHVDYAPERLLGRRTGELHVALSEIDLPDFAPVPITEGDIAADVRRVQAGIEQDAVLLRERENELPAPLQAQLPHLLAVLRQTEPRAAGFRDEAGTWRIRVHGDYHLGQTLRTPDGDWTIVDFEGEPARPVAERRQQTSALKDVAGMLRSFAYAHGAAARAVGSAAAEERLGQWERGAREAFLAAYRDAVAAAPVRLVPDDAAAFQRAVAAWELDKTLYEIAYEARNRPGWLGLPLRVLAPEIPDQGSADTGGAPA